MKLNQNGGSKTDTIVKLILVFFVSLLSFSVGTFVGKQFSDSQHRLASLEKDYQNEANEGRSTASVQEEGLDVKPNEILSQEDVAKLAEEFVQDIPDAKAKREVANTADTHGETHKESEEVVKKETAAVKKVETSPAPTTKETEAAVHNQAPVHKEVHGLTVDAAAKKVAEGKPVLEPVAKKVEAPKKISLPKVTSVDVQGKYTIQVSSHPSENDAKTQAQDLVTKGFSAFYVPALIDGKTWYRVSVGNFSTAETAKEYLGKIKANAVFKDSIVRKVVQ